MRRGTGEKMQRWSGEVKRRRRREVEWEWEWELGSEVEM